MNKLIEFGVMIVLLAIVAFGGAIFTSIGVASVLMYLLGGVVIAGFVANIREHFRIPAITASGQGVAASIRVSIQAFIQLLSRIAIGALVIVFMLQGGFWFLGLQ